jgi:hypothetical protein
MAIYRHYKGGFYRVIGTATHTETQEELVIYEGIDGRVWARPRDMFFEEVEVDGKKVPRFQRLGREGEILWNVGRIAAR